MLLDGYVGGVKKKQENRKSEKEYWLCQIHLFFFFSYCYIQFMEHKGKKCLICPCGYTLESIVYSRVDFWICIKAVKKELESNGSMKHLTKI